MRYTNIFFILFLILCSMVNITQNRKSTKTVKDTLTFDLDLENVDFIQVHGENKMGSRNSIKSQLQKRNQACGGSNYQYKL